MKKNTIYLLVIPLFFFVLTLVYLFSLAQGLILLPLDMLVSNYSPWYSPGQILVKNPYMQDSILQIFPWKHLVFQSFQNHIIPFWNPYQLMGMPFMAGMKPMVFYPLNIFYLFGEINAWHMLLFSQIFLSLLFMYLLARSFKLGLLPSIFASLIFSLNTMMMGLLEFGSDGHALLWFPLLIFCAKKYLEKQKNIYLFILGISIGTSIFAGQLQYTGYILLFLGIFILYYGYLLKIQIRIFVFIFLAIILGIGVSAVELVPGFGLFFHSVRGVTSSYTIFANGLDNPVQVFRLFAPDFFGNPVTRDLTIGYIESIGYFGIIPLFFSIYAIVFVHKNIFVRFFSISAIIYLLFSIKGIGQILFLLHIPVITSGEGDRIFSLVYPSCAILAGFGVTEFLNTKDKKRNIFALLLFLLLFLSVIALKAFTDILTVKLFLRNIQFTALIFGSFFIFSCLYISFRGKNTLSKMIFLLLIVSLTYVDLFRVGYHFLTFSNKKFLYPQVSVAKYIQSQSKYSLARNIGLTEPELATYLNVYTIETYNPLYLQRSAELLQSLQKKNPKNLPLNNKYFITNGLAEGENLKYALDVLGVSQFVVDKNVNPSLLFFNTPKYEANFTRIYNDEKYSVYKNLSVYPRFGLYYKNIVKKNDTEILSTIASRTINLRDTVLLSESLPITLQQGSGSAKLISSDLNSQVFKIDSTKPGLFYISDTFYPGWEAVLNNHSTKIYQANYNFRAVLVPAGKSILVFTYTPTNFFFGIFISIFSLFLLFSFLFFPRFRK